MYNNKSTYCIIPTDFTKHANPKCFPLMIYLNYDFCNFKYVGGKRYTKCSLF